MNQQCTPPSQSWSVPYATEKKINRNETGTVTRISGRFSYPENKSISRSTTKIIASPFNRLPRRMTSTHLWANLHHLADIRKHSTGGYEILRHSLQTAFCETAVTYWFRMALISSSSVPAFAEQQLCAKRFLERLWFSHRLHPSSCGYSFASAAAGEESPWRHLVHILIQDQFSVPHFPS